MLTLRVRIASVDTYGWNGRESPPVPAHRGQIGTVVAISLHHEWGDNDTDYARRRPEWQWTTKGVQTFVVQLDNGPQVECMGHELELLSASHDGDL